MSNSLCKTSVVRIYQEVIEDVISGVRELFIEDGVDEQVLQELRQAWETKLLASKAVQNETEDKVKKQEPIMPSNGFAKPIIPPSQQVPPQQTQPHPVGQVQSIAETKMVPIQITLPPQPGTDGGQRVLTIQVPATALQGNQLQKVLTGPVITATMGLPPAIASSLLQQHVNAAFSSQQQAVAVINKNVVQTDGTHSDMEESVEVEPSSSCCKINKKVSLDRPKKKSNRRELKPKQLDGSMDTSDEDEEGTDDDDDEDLDDEKDDEDQEIEDEGGEEEPLNSEDDVSDDDPTDLFDTDNIVVCQYDKIIRNRNKWKFYLKDGIMNLNGLDYVFQKANGDAEW